MRQSHIRGREELGENIAICHTRERLRRPAADIGSLARGNPYMASRRIAPATELRANARAQRTTCYRAAFGGRRPVARLVTRDNLGNSMHRNLTPSTNLDRIPKPASYASANGESTPPKSVRSSAAC